MLLLPLNSRTMRRGWKTLAIVFLLTFLLTFISYRALKNALGEKYETVPVIVSRLPLPREACIAYSELRNVNFLHREIKENICENGAAYTIVDSAFPLCLLKRELPQLLTDTVKAGSIEATLKSPVSQKSIPCFVYSSPDLISKEIRETHIFEERSIRAMQKVIKKFHEKAPVTFVDIGSNIGVFTLSALDLGVPVIALDANIRNLMRIKLSYEAANLPHKLHLMWNFVSRQVTLKYLNFPQDCNIGGATKFGRAVSDTIPVMSTTADSMVELIDTKLVVLKVDIEGGEGEFFKSAKKMFDLFTIPVVQMEWLKRHMSEEERRFMIQFFKERHYGPREVKDLTASANISAINFESDQVIWIQEDYLSHVLDALKP